MLATGVSVRSVPITVASYNMSFASDQGFYGDMVKSVKGKPGKNTEGGFFPSEARFLRRANSPREFWINAKNHLLAFIMDKKPHIVGLQEMNPTPGIEELCAELPPNYTSKTACVPTNGACLLTVWDKNVLGECVGEPYVADLGETVDDEGTALFVRPVPNGPPGDGGRPISIIKTTKGFVLVNLHGPNKPADSVAGAPAVRKALNLHAQKAGIARTEIQKLFVTGDFNDRAHGISNEAKLSLIGMDLTTGRAKGEGAFSCCYNWDSADTGLADMAAVEAREGGKIPKSLDELAAIAKYKFTGDYCLGSSVSQPLTIVPSPVDENGASIASDHELVYAVFNTTMQGGKRSKGRRSTRKAKAKKSKQAKKSKASRKH